MTRRALKATNSVFGWANLWLLTDPRLLRFASGSAFIVPILARVSSATQEGWAAVMLQFLDAQVFTIPVNLLRIFWAGFFLLVAQVVVRLAAPQVTRSKSDSEWLSTTAIRDEIAFQLHEQGSENKEVIIKGLMAEFHTNFAEANVKKNIPRFIASFLFIISAVLIATVLFSQLLIVYQATLPLLALP